MPSHNTKTNNQKLNILISGGSGFVGNFLTQKWKNHHNIFILSRKNINIDGSKVFTSINDINNNIDVVINLAGANISKYWTKSYKQTLIDSRISSTKLLVEWMKNLNKKPQLMISASAVGYYGSRSDNAYLDEDSPFINDFTHSLCDAWEKEALKAQEIGVRVCIARLGVVIGKEGGMLKQILTPFNLGLGGKIGHARQGISWVAKQDVLKAFSFFIENKKLNGAFNITAPNPVSNAVFTLTLAKILKRPAIFNLPYSVAKILFGEMGKLLLLRGQYVKPKRLINEGFSFEYKILEDIFRNELNKHS